MTTATMDRRALVARLNDLELALRVEQRDRLLRMHQARADRERAAERRRLAGLTECQRVREEAEAILDRLPIDPDAARHRIDWFRAMRGAA